MPYMDHTTLCLVSVIRKQQFDVWTRRGREKVSTQYARTIRLVHNKMKRRRRPPSLPSVVAIKHTPHPRFSHRRRHHHLSLSPRHRHRSHTTTTITHVAENVITQPSAACVFKKSVSSSGDVSSVNVMVQFREVCCECWMWLFVCCRRIGAGVREKVRVPLLQRLY